MSTTLGKGTGTINQYNQPAFVATRLTGAFCSRFDMNDLLSHKYETLPIEGYKPPGYTGHIPGGLDTYAQRKQQANLHFRNHMATASALPKDLPYTDMAMVDLRPETRSMSKVYMYAEAAKSNFLKFPKGKAFDHRRS